MTLLRMVQSKGFKTVQEFCEFVRYSRRSINRYYLYERKLFDSILDSAVRKKERLGE